MSIRPGHKVLIKKPKDVTELPTWTLGMDVYDGRVCVIQRVYPYSRWIEFTVVNPPDVGGWAFNSNWATPIENTKEVCQCSWPYCRKVIK